MTSFNYQTTLDINQIRLLTLHPSGEPTDPIQCHLETCTLADVPQYEALSYCWGDASQRLLIFCDGRPFYAMENLEAALRQLRHADKNRVMWIDAICINQDDPNERACQVSLMRDIYSRARRVVVWLGVASSDSDLVFPLCWRMVKHRWELLAPGVFDENEDRLLFGKERREKLEAKLAELKKAREPAVGLASDSREGEVNGVDKVVEPGKDLLDGDHALVDDLEGSGHEAGEGEEEINLLDMIGTDSDPTDSEITAFLRLVKRPWFRRCWVVQEICLGVDPVVFCGAWSIDWDIFCLGFTLAIILSDNGMRGRPEQLLQGGIVMMDLLRKGIQGHSDGLIRDFLGLLWNSRGLDATDPRDKIYSLLGLLREDELRRLNIQPDYVVSTAECYTRAAREVLKSNGNLDLLLTDRLISTTVNLPSWVPDWSTRDVPGPQSLVRDIDRVPDDKLSLRPFRASGSSKYDVRIDTAEALLLSGHTFDRIVALEETVTVPQMDQETLQVSFSSFRGFGRLVRTLSIGLGTYFDTLVKWEALALSSSYPTYPTGEDPLVAFAMTLSCGNTPYGEEVAMAEFEKWRKTIKGAGRIAFLRKLAGRSWLYTSLVAFAGVYSGWNYVAEGTFTTATEPTLYRRLGRTEKGYLTLLPRQSQEGDEIVLLKGGKMPFVVRGRGRQKELVGACYVHGIMYGEAWDEGRCEEVEFC